MKKMRLILSLAALLAPIALFAQEAPTPKEKNVAAEAGKLSEKITEEEKTTVTFLKVTGTVNHEDFRFINKNMKALTTLDLGEVTIAELKKDSTKTYPADVIFDYAFEGNKTITKITFPKALKKIGANAFKSNVLEELIFPESLEEIGVYAFSFNKQLTKVTFPASCKTLGNFSFNGCEKLASVTFADGLVAVGDYAFRNCKVLADVTLPKTLEKIGSKAFSGCAAFTTLDLPESVKSIGEAIIAENTNQKTLVCRSATPAEAQTKAFDETIYANVELRIPEAAYDNYMDHPVWSMFKRICDLNGKPLAVNEVIAADDCGVVAGEGCLQVVAATPATVAVYDLNGACVVAEKVVAAGETIPVFAGAYVVVANGKASKVLVK